MISSIGLARIIISLFFWLLILAILDHFHKQHRTLCSAAEPLSTWSRYTGDMGIFHHHSSSTHKICPNPSLNKGIKDPLITMRSLLITSRCPERYRWGHDVLWPEYYHIWNMRCIYHHRYDGLQTTSCNTSFQHIRAGQVGSFQKRFCKLIANQNLLPELCALVPSSPCILSYHSFQSASLQRRYISIRGWASLKVSPSVRSSCSFATTSAPTSINANSFLRRRRQVE